MISVVIPCYNRAALLARAIDSALAQGRYVGHVIVVDDGSTDNTREICTQYAGRVEYVWQKNAGPSAARNTGVNHARNEWVAFLDSDDYWTPAHLERMAKAIEQTDGAARFYFSDMQMGEGNATTLWQMVNFVPPHPIYLTEDGTNWAFLRHQPMMLQCSVFRRDSWVESGGLDPRFHLKHDADLFFRLSIRGKICAVSGVGCVWTDDDAGSFRLTAAVHPGQAAYWEEMIALWREVAQRFPNLPTKYRRMVWRGVASAHWRLSRLYWSLGKPGKCAWQLPIAGWADPSLVLSLLGCRSSNVNCPAVSPEYS
jgi:glycosyltransferase involved in cell wall biosynthesis